jgi:hypothetical protein
LKLHFCTGPLRSLRSLQKCPWFALRPSERLGTLQCSPRAPAGGGPAKFQRTGGRDQPGAGGRQPAGSLGPISTLGWGGGGAGGVVQRRRPVPAAVRPAPPSSWPGQANGWRGRHQQGLGEGEELLAGCGDTWRWKLSGTGTHGAWRGAVPPRAKSTSPIYRRSGLPMRAHGC